MNERFLFFENFKHIADNLPDDMRLKFYDGLLAYVFDGVEPEDAYIAALITAIKPSLDKEDKRGGNHNPTGLNQYSEVKTGQKEVKNNFEQVKSGQSGQSFLETGNRKQETGNNLNNIPSNEGGKTEKINFALSQINSVFEKYGLPKVLKLTEQRKTKLKQRIRDVGNFNNFITEVEKALAESSFLRGDNSRSWAADFDFFLQASSWQKVLEGKYADKQQKDDADYWADLEKRVEAANA